MNKYRKYSKYIGFFLLFIAVLDVLEVSLDKDFWGTFALSNTYAFSNLVERIISCFVGAVLAFGFGMNDWKKCVIALACGVIAYGITFMYTNFAYVENSEKVNVTTPMHTEESGRNNAIRPPRTTITPPRTIRKEICSICHGTGYRTCIVCSGTGKTLNRVPDPPRYIGTEPYRARPIYETCSICHGTGNKVCIGCSGAGYIIY